MRFLGNISEIGFVIKEILLMSLLSTVIVISEHIALFNPIRLPSSSFT